MCLIFCGEIFLFSVIVTGILPRSVVPYFALALALYTLFTPLEEAVLFFVQSIPLFIAIPITTSWDNFNTWRILSIIIFLRWIFSKGDFKWILNGLRDFFKAPIKFSRAHPILVLSSCLLLTAFCSLAGAPDLRAGFARIIYFINLSLIGIVVYDNVRRSTLDVPQLLRSISISTILVVIVGYIQLISTYLMDVYQFMRLWGEIIQKNQFGELWSHIAVYLGNTWLAYYGPQLSLRVFSLFTDSHTFPMYVLFGLPTLLAFGILRILKRPASDIDSLRKMIRVRANMSILWVPIAFLIVILSGTRGIWAASIPTVTLALLMGTIHMVKVPINKRLLFKYISLYLATFFMLFAVAYPIFVSPQFLLSKGDWALFGNRIRSIIDFGETSNAIRLQIWKQSVISIAHHPLLGVGIGNFPVVLDQEIFLAKAGSTAHNVYLHIAAEMGIPALLLALAFLWLIWKSTWQNFLHETDPLLSTFYGAMALFLPWNLAYLMTDAALFDERVFLMFVVIVALALEQNKNRG